MVLQKSSNISKGKDYNELPYYGKFLITGEGLLVKE